MSFLSDLFTSYTPFQEKVEACTSEELEGPDMLANLGLFLFCFHENRGVLVKLLCLDIDDSCRDLRRCQHEPRCVRSLNYFIIC